MYFFAMKLFAFHFRQSREYPILSTSGGKTHEMLFVKIKKVSMVIIESIGISDDYFLFYWSCDLCECELSWDAIHATEKMSKKRPAKYP